MITVTSLNLGNFHLLEEAVKATKRFVFDVECVNFNESLLGVSFCAGENAVFFFYTLPTLPDHSERIEKVVGFFTEIFAAGEVEVIAHNLQFDLGVLRKYGVPIPTEKIHDTMIMAWLLNENQISSKGLKQLSEEHLQLTWTTWAELNKNREPIDIPEEELGNYSGMDSYATWRLFHFFTPQLVEENLWALYTKVEMRLLPVLLKMELAGISIDSDMLETVGKQITLQMREIEKQVYQSVGRVFNLQSTVILGKILHEEMKLPCLEMTKSGWYSTNEKSLQWLASKGHELPKLLLEYRELNKIQSTYIAGVLKLLDPHTSKIHPRYIQIGTDTGRLSSREPNIQNIPRSTGRIREAVIAPPGEKFIIADYSQMELRVLAIFSGDPVLVQSFASGRDVHKIAASRIFKKREEDVTDVERHKAKVINFGVIYGMQENKLAETLKISVSAAQKILKSYFDEYVGVNDYARDTRRFLHKHGYVLTILKRRRRLSEVYSSNSWERLRAERQAVNARIQGCKKFDQRVLTSGGYVPICELRGQPIFDGVGWTSNYQLYETGEKYCYTVACKDGRRIQASEDDVVLKWNSQTVRVENCRIKNLKIDDIVVSPNILAPCGEIPADIVGVYNGSWRATYKKILQPDEVQLNEAYLLGYLVGDGYYKRPRGFYIAVGDRENAERIKKLIENLYPDLHVRVTEETKGRKNRLFQVHADSVIIRDRLLKLGLDFVSKKEKRIPKWIYEAPPDYRAKFLQGYYDADGTFNKKGTVYLTSVVEELAHGVYLLLNSLGIQAGWRTYKQTQREGATFCRVDIGGKNVWQFAEIVGFANTLKLNKIGGWSGDNIKENRSSFQFEGLSKIIKIEPIGVFKTFDIEIFGENHAYVCEGLLVHNSAADIMKLAMIKLDRELVKLGCGQIVCQVHDELLVQVPESRAEEISFVVRDCMIHPLAEDLSVALEVDLHIGDQWSEKTRKGEK